MSLSSAVNTAQAIFRNTGEQSSVISKNIANAGNANYVRRSAVVATTMYGAQVVTTERAQNDALLRQTLDSTAGSSGQETLLAGLEQLQALLGGNDYELAPSTYIAELRDSLQAFAAKPGELSLAETAINTAQDVARSLNTASEGVQSLRAQADREIETSVATLNDLLAQFKIANDAVTSATAVNGDPNDALDQRETLTKQISEIIGVTAVTRTNNDMVLYTADGTTLFETSPRTVSFERIIAYGPATEGNPVYIDGVALDSGAGGNTTAQGSLAASLQLRDEIAPIFQNQLDEVARGLVTVFSEVDPLTPGSEMPGLFTWEPATPPAYTPAAGTVEPGIAATITVNTALLSSAGGDPMLLRDGGINGAAYIWNATGGSGYSDLLDGYVTGMDADMAFDTAAQLDDQASLMTYATDSVGWLEELRSNATTASENKAAMLQRATQAYQNETGVSLDEELSLLLDIEQSYKASTKLMSAVDEMLTALIEMAG